MNDKPYRHNAAAVIINDEGHILTGWKHKCWQLPQGGVDTGETFYDAVIRETAEEIGTDKFRILKESEELHVYDWPGPVSGKKARYRGQKQKYFLIKFEGEEDEINPHIHGELSAIKWMTPEEVISEAWDIKRPLYKKVLEEFGLLNGGKEK